MKNSIYIFISVLFLGIILLLANQVVKANLGEAFQDIR